ncbi:MAG: SPFH/Band 7/PHB domain protein [Bdellovibrionaceae bacterium]|jgi:regulator of protease activity HflC (stomatin/prohibitin superfamily)|nr:SPFH/Band 7/PHB domain protein [Pseudobdellovibrionaceae bacterium]
MDLGLILTLAFLGFGVLLVAKGIRVVQQSECMVIERLGSFDRVLHNGLNIIVPFVEKPRSMYWVDNQDIWNVIKIDLRETVLDVPEQAVITKDNVSINIDALMYIQITDPRRAVYEISNLPTAVAQLAQTSLRNVIGEMDLDETLASRDHINTKLKTILDEATDKWGTKINRVELKNITPPHDIQMAMEKQMQAERERRAKVLEAEGDRQSRIERSEGQKQEQINLAEGDKEAQVRRAEGEAEALKEVAHAKKIAIDAIKSSLGTNELTAQYLIASSYLEKFGEFTQKSGDKVFIPYESSEALGSLGGIKELLNK